MFTQDQINSIVAEAKEAAYLASAKYFTDELGGVDQYACGFAWTNIYKHDGKKINGRTKIGKMLEKAGVDKDWRRTYEMWNPSGFHCQNIDTLEAGARAAAEVFRQYGFEAYAGSRLD